MSASSPKYAPTQAELIAYLRDALAKSAKTGSEVKRDIVERVIRRVIAAFRSDSRPPAKTALQWEALLADAACRRPSKSMHEVIFTPRREHSRKPSKLFHCIEQHCSGPYAELFGPQRRWDSGGDEFEKFT